MISFDYGGIELDTIQRDHLPTLRSWRNHPQIRKWCRQNDLISAKAQEEWFERMSSDSTIKMYSIHTPTIGLPAGVCGFTSIDPLNRRAEFSLYIGPNIQRQGLGSNALKTLFTHGFKNLGLHIIWGECFMGNPAMDLFEKVGMRIEGRRKDFYFRDGHFIDVYLVSVSDEEWKERWYPQP